MKPFTPSHDRRNVQRCWWAGPAVCAVTLLALPASANYQIPTDPLTTAARIAPNILFILDDSGSMAFDYMPDSVPSTSAPNVASTAYTRNSLAYNPALTYEPWMQSDGVRMSGGTSYSAVYGSFNLVGGSTIDLGDASSCGRFNYNNSATVDEYRSGARQVCGGVQTFHVPKDPTQQSAGYLGNGQNYYRYQITEGGSDVIRSEYGVVSVLRIPIDGQNQLSGTLSNSSISEHYTSAMQPGRSLDIVFNNTSASLLSSRDLNIWVYAPGGAQVCAGTISKGNSARCPITSTVAGQYRIAVRRGDNRDVNYNIQATSSNSCGSETSGNGWINCTSTLPSSRSLAGELRNYATWFSYHRTRMKSAKAGASEAFSSLDGKVRVGFRTIWDRSGSRFNIPVGDGNDGRFVDSAGQINTYSRSTWYSRLHGVMGYNGTPLHDALDAAGRYFSLDTATGPYGPQVGSEQFSCRQNFSILTTDGYWNNVGVDVGNQDNTAGLPISGPNGQSYRYSPSAPYRDSYSNTLADVAMKYWKTDLRPDMVNNVPVTAANPAFWQHMVTFGISIGLRGNKPWSSVAQVPQDATWEDPTDREDADRIDDLLHAAVNSRGAFVAASNPAEFTEGLTSALAAIAQRTSSFSNVATNSVSLDAGTRVFNASYVSGIWTGSVTARAVGRTGASETVAWSATTPAWDRRNVYTASATSIGVPGTSGTTFPTQTQTNALAREGGPANYQVTGEENARYIKGKPGLEVRNGGILRNRTSIIGDIVGSSPAYVKDSDTLFVGSNGGMLHAFDASTGEELFAYVPNIVNFSWLSTLSRGDYAHRFLVDGPVVVSEKRVTPDKNFLVGTLGKGGKGLYSLDVTDPTASASALFKWERNETPGQNMGLVLGKPFYANAANGSAIVVLGNGVNSARNRAVLLVLNAENGQVIREIDTGVGSATLPNGLSAATGVYGSDGRTLAYVYAGDMQGNVWKFDLTARSAASWSFKRLFTASANEVAQPITSGITVSTHPRTRKTWVFFGTGRYLLAEDADASSAASSAVQSMYGFMENEGDQATEPVRISELTRRNLSNTGQSMDGYAVRTFDAKAPLPENSKGWYINLPDAGERIVQDAQVVSSFLVTASMVPRGSACEADGSGYINALDAFTGTSGGGSYFDLNGDGSTDDSVVGGLPVGSINPGVGMPTLPNLLRGVLLVGGTSGDVKGPATLMPRWDRVSWREVRRD